jgi:anti-sigma B factor antagonist
MEITTEQRGHVTVVSIVGSVDGLTASGLVGSFRKEFESGNIRIVGDFAGVDYTSSAGLRALLETVKETRQRGGDLRLAAVQRDVLRVLELSGFTHILRLFPDTESAVASFPVPGPSAS